MSEVAVQKQIPVVVDSPSHNRNIARAVKDQEELDQLMKDAEREQSSVNRQALILKMIRLLVEMQ